jgi:hypothetical protein
MESEQLAAPRDPSGVHITRLGLAGSGDDRIAPRGCDSLESSIDRVSETMAGIRTLLRGKTLDSRSCDTPELLVLQCNLT